MKLKGFNFIILVNNLGEIKMKNIDSGLVLIKGFEEFREIRGILKIKGNVDGWLYIDGVIKLVRKSFRIDCYGIKKDLWRVL